MCHVHVGLQVWQNSLVGEGEQNRIIDAHSQREPTKEMGVGVGG